ncbi:MAG: hypothetical protein N0C84_01370 [Candidatus Thiodiazotropha taylori]|uniref:DNA-directed DNA polymerase n=1 Tax=Candidatus Thiodiazotropha taylori TaxID=2792791 RepID=A0A9E4N1T6_9GAMM|nr:hypothetical protein [Candidatus Thiodiazotropha taylori]MCW4255097.1 hypothetical protein [Candidatus Thiodiazotropha taylori]
MEKIDYYTNIRQYGNTVYVRGVKNGQEVRFKDYPEVTCYTLSDKDCGYKTIDGRNIKPSIRGQIKDVKNTAHEFKGTNVEVFGFPYYQHQYILDNYKDSVTKWDKNHIRVFNIDIEVSSDGGFPSPYEAPAPVTAISLYDSVEDKFVAFGIGDWHIRESSLSPDVASKVCYFACENEMALFTKFLAYWKKFTPNIVTGWNVEGFDIPYIYQRLDNLGFDVNKLSPWGKIAIKETQSKSGEPMRFIVPVGVDVIDYMVLYKKNSVQESYRLDFVATVELGEKKSLPTQAMLDISRTPFTAKPSKVKYELTDDEEFNKFVKIRNERVDTQNDEKNPNRDLETEILLKKEKATAFQLFISYNIQDVNLVKNLDEKLGLLDAQIMIAYEACLNPEETLSPVRVWDSLINIELNKSNIIPPYHVTKSEATHIPGGFVKQPHIGKHGWVVSFDLNSLYPHLIMQFNISPETLDKTFALYPGMDDEKRLDSFLAKEEYKSDPAYSMAASGYRFDNSFEGVIPKLMREMYENRKAFKKQMIEKQKRGEDATREHLKQYVLKILLNSGYGALNNPYFRWFDMRLGKSITLSGQYVIQVAERVINEWMNRAVGTTGKDYIIAIDTDSNYVNFQPLVDKHFSNKSQEELVDIIDKISSQKLQEALDKGFEEAANYMTARDQKMVMEREAIASSAFWTAKKRYAMCVWDMEGVRMPKDKPKIKIQGLEAIRSSTPYVCRQPLLDVINLALLQDETSVHSYIKEFKDQFYSLPIEEIAMPRTMNNIKKYTIEQGFRKSTPPHIRGAIQFNRLLSLHNLDNVWEPIKDGEKGKFIYLKQPNNTSSDTISFMTDIPTEYGVVEHVDLDKMWEKIIVDPAKGILQPLGWTVEKRITLDSFF